MAKRETGPAQPVIPANAQYSESDALTFSEGAEPVAARQPGNPGAAPTSAKVSALSKIDDSRSEIVKWGNGEESDVQTITLTEDDPAPTTTTDPPAERTKAPAKPATGKPDDETTEETPAVAAKPPVDADKRRQILESLDKEKQRVGIENRIKEEQDKREAAEAKLAEFEKSPLGRKLATIAKQHGMSLDDLKDKLLIGADDVLDKPDAAPVVKEKDPEVVALLAWKADKEKAEDDQRIQQSIGHVREALKETDLPMIDAFDAYGRVLVKAHAGWVAGGKKGTVAEFVPTAADIVEDELKAERPNAAKRLYPKAEEEAAEAAEVPVARATPRPAMGKRQAAKPGVKPAPLPMDPYERSQEIKRRQGWL